MTFAETPLGTNKIIDMPTDTPTEQPPTADTPPERDPYHQPQLQLTGLHEKLGIILGNPHNYTSWSKALETPENFANLDKIEKQIREHPERYLTLNEALTRTGGNLNYALLQLLIPQLTEEQTKRIEESEAFKKLRPLLLLFLYRFPSRINGIVYLLEQATKQDCQDLETRERFVGTKKHKGSVIRIDMKEFTTHTHHQGEAATAELMRMNFYPPFFEVVRCYPNVKFIDTIGDEIVCVIENPQGDEDAKFAQDLAAKFTVDTHIGIGRGDYEVTITPHGKVVVGGEASDASLTVQKTTAKGDKESKIHVRDYDRTIQHHKPSQTLDLPEPPASSAIHFFRGIPLENLEDMLNDPNELLEAVKQQMAMVACPITQTALRLENPIELKATTLCVTAPVAESGNVISWEAQLEELAAQYDGTVLHLEISEGKRKGIIVFGALGSSPFDKEERIARCTKQLTATVPDCKIGIASGPMLISDTSKEGTISDSVNRAARLAHADDSKRVAKKRPGDPELGQVRMDAETAENLRKAGIIPEGEFTDLELQIKGTGRQRTTTCEGLEIQSTEHRYVRRAEVTRLVTEIKAALRSKDPTTQLHFNLEGPSGMGQREILKTAAKELGELGDNRVQVIELTGPRLAGDRQKHESYNGIGELITQRLFPTEDDLKIFMDQHAIAEDSVQRLRWISLYRELGNRQTRTNILGSTTTAKAEIISILRTFENLGVACERIDRMDDVSREILKESGVILMTTSCPSATHNLELKGVTLEEAAAITAHELGTESAPEEIGGLISSRIPADVNGLFNPMLVEALIDDLIKVETIREGDDSYFNAAPAETVEASQSVTQLQQGMVHTKLARINDPAADELLRTAIMLGNCTRAELETALGEPLQESSIAHLTEIGILVGSPTEAAITFAASFPVEVASRMHQLDEAAIPNLETRIRGNIEEGGDLSLGRYLEICRKVNMHTSANAIRLTAVQARTMLDQGRKIETMDVCEQFFEMNHDLIIAPAFARKMTPEIVEDILQIHYALIEAKIAVGRSPACDLARLREFNAPLASFTEYHIQDLSSAEADPRLRRMSPIARGEYFLLACKAAYRAKDDETLERLIPQLELHYPEHLRDVFATTEIALLKAQLHYRLADKQKQSDAATAIKVETRKAEVGKALEELDKIDMTSIKETSLEKVVTCFKFQVEGYSLLEAGISDDPDAIPDYIRRLSTYLDANQDEYGEDENLLEAELYLVRAEIGKVLGTMMPQLAKGEALTATLADFRNADARIRRNLEASRNNGYVKTTLKSLNYFMNVVFFQNLLQGKKYDPAIALDMLTEEGEAAYQESARIQQGLSVEDESGVSIDIAGNMITRLEIINLQLEILADNRELRPGAETPIISKGEETVALLLMYMQKFPQIKPVWQDKYINPEIEKFDELKLKFASEQAA